MAFLHSLKVSDVLTQLLDSTHSFLEEVTFQEVGELHNRREREMKMDRSCSFSSITVVYRRPFSQHLEGVHS